MLIDKVSNPEGIVPSNKFKVNKARSIFKEAGNDQANISEEAKKAYQAQERSRVVEAAKEIVKKSPDIRKERIEEVQARLSSGYYNNNKIIEQVADKIAQSLLRS